jgi:hypothetical protein
MHPVPSAGAIKVEQYTQQVEDRMAFLVEQNIKQFLAHDG